ncbi:MAG: S8 family serine peptidase, partial [bacterium]
MKRISERANCLATGAAWLWGLAALLAPWGALNAQPSAPPGAPDAVFPAEARFVPNQLLIQFQARVGKSEQADVRGRVGARLEERITTAPMRGEGRGDLELVSLPPGIAIASAIRGLQDHPAVE